MSKSVLVMDTPESCSECKIGRDMSGYMEICIICPIANKVALNEEAETVPEWCPLKPLPEKDDFDDPYEEYYTGYRDGWNDCLREIVRGKNK